MKKILLIDNYDSLTYNLVQYLRECGAEVLVYKNDALTVQQAMALRPDALVISPGPGSVLDSTATGNAREILQGFRGHVPVLGVCLGHQLIAHTLGARIVHAEPAHGEVHTIAINPRSVLFAGLPDTIPVARYHSMIAVWDTLPQGVQVTAHTNDALQHLMAFEVPHEKLFGVQFHPESIGTPKDVGMQILTNFLGQVGPKV